MSANPIQVLGCPIPLDEHAVSVSLPAWAHVVGYEEGHEHVVNAMKLGYPRFKVHSSIEKLIAVVRMHHKSMLPATEEAAENNIISTVYPSRPVAERFLAFLRKSLASDLNVDGSSDEQFFAILPVGFLDLHAIYFPESLKGAAKCYWQHTGELVSSRLAEDALEYFGSVFPRGSDSSKSITHGYSTALKPRRHSSSDEFSCENLTGSEINRQPSSEEGFRKGKVSGKALGLSIDTENEETLAGPGANQQAVMPPESGSKSTEAVVRSRIAALCNEKNIPGAVTITVSGMASVFTALRMAQSIFVSNWNSLHVAQGKQPSSGIPQTEDRSCLQYADIVVFGFPYLDTLKMMRRPELNPGSCLFYGTGEEDDLNALESVLKAQKAERDSTTGPVRKVAAVFAEFPTNPLLKCTDLKRLSRWALEYDFLLIVDDTISGYSNTDLLHTPDACVDIVCSSLTKAFSGTGDVLAGAVVVNSHGRYASQLRDVVQYSLALPRVYRLDALVLERNSRDYAERCGKMSSNARALSEWLLRHPSVRSVHYPGLSEASTCTGVDGVVAMNDTAAVSHARYTALLRADNPTAGYGCLFSVLFKENVNVEAFYDVIDLHKGPSLGTNFTLISPYTLLAHYCELDWAASYGVEKELIRVSAGTEDTADLIAHFSMAIVAATHRYEWMILEKALRKKWDAICAANCTGSKAADYRLVTVAARILSFIYA